LTETVDDKVPFFTSFIRSQMTSLIATAFDYLVFFTCVELMEVYYVTAAAISAAVGAIISFYLGRTWAFRRRDGSLSAQAVKYLLTSGVSLFLNTAGIYLLTDYANIPYGFSKVIISILIGIFFNFLMYRYFVYR